MSEINTVNEQLMLMSDVVATRDEISTKLMESGDSVDNVPKSKSIRRNIEGGGDVVDKKIIVANNELISVVAHQDKMKVVVLRSTPPP